ncbi:hypothetical protein [Streptomyces sp. NPDC059928]|uniref:hypothetical protein n=1 Tax=unclassified Streptomyces TaxID=2593676 RepID=UPI00364D7783
MVPRGGPRTAHHRQPATPPPRHQAVIRDHARRIRGGSLPALVALRPAPDSLTGYLLDGHHKLAAYHRTGIRPLILWLTPQQPKHFPREAYEHARAAFLADHPDHERKLLDSVLACIHDEARHLA